MPEGAEARLRARRGARQGDDAAARALDLQLQSGDVDSGIVG